MTDLFDIARARNSDPVTSHEAADSVNRIRESQQHVLDVLRIWGAATDEEIYERLGTARLRISPSGARTRRSELVTKNLVVASGDYGLTASGRRSIKWRAV